MQTLTARPITAEAFRPYGQVLSVPDEAGRTYFSEALANGRAEAGPSLSLAHVTDVAALPLDAVQMERHPFSSQSFVPLDVGRYLAVVAPHHPDGGPNIEHMQAFIVPGDTGITYGPDVWHHPLTVLDRPARFAIFMWLTGGDGDEEFRDLVAPVRIASAD